jgi:hypothetical protein
MRGVLVGACLLAGCELYFGPGEQPQQQHADARRSVDATRADAHGYPDADPPDAHPSSFTFATCAGGQLYRSDPQATDVPPADPGAAYASCAGACITPGGVYDCLGDPTCAGAGPWLCASQAGCPRLPACGTGPYGSGLSNSVCAGAGGCSDGLCSPLAVLHAIAGHWQGTVTPPSFSPPYGVDLVIAADGHVSPHRDDGQYGVAFYYGDDGPNPDRWFRIGTVTPDGAVGTVGVMFSPQEILPGLVTELHVDATHLTFAFWDGWLDCTRRFDFALTRAP